MPFNIQLSKICETHKVSDVSFPVETGKLTTTTLRRRLLLRHVVVGLARLELATSSLSGMRSNHLSYRPLVFSPRDPNPQVVELIGIEPTTS